jgi:hypothetical protein
MDNEEERIREIVRREMEIFIKAHGWPDEVVQQALLDVAKNHLWKQGFAMRLKYWANIVGFLGIIAGAVALVVSVLGYDVVRR